MKVKKIFGFIFSALLAALVLISAFYTYKNISSVLLLSPLRVNDENLFALNRPSQKNDFSGKNLLAYRWTQNQYARLMSMQETPEAASVFLEFDVSFRKKGEKILIAFLDEKDITSKNRLSRSFSFNDLATQAAAVSPQDNFENKTIGISLCIPRHCKTPAGIAVFTDAKKTRVKSLSFDKAKIGFSRGEKKESDEWKVFFGPSGGIINAFEENMDFSDGKNIFDSDNKSGILPKIEIELYEEKERGPYDEQRRIVFTDLNSSKDCNAKFSRRLSPSVFKSEIQMSAFTDFFPSFSIEKDRGLVKSLVMISNSSSMYENSTHPLIPFTTDLGLMLEWPEENWRCSDYELYRWELFPSVLFFDFSDYKIQDLFFTRIAFFVEKAGYVGTLVDDDFIKNNHGYNAHDYKAVDLASFFNKVKEENFAINDMEKILCSVLLKNGIIIQKKDGSFKAGKGSVLSISRQSPSYLRYSLLAHESWHGVYFDDEDFRNVVALNYGMFDSRSMEFIKTFWETQPNLGYDRNDEYLMQNEFMAYIMQQSYSSCAPYFLQIAGRGSVNRIQGEDAAYIREIGAKTFEDASAVFNSYVYDRWGLACGRVRLIDRLN